MGETVRANERLATVDCGDAKADLEASEAELELQRLKSAQDYGTPDLDDVGIAKSRVELAESLGKPLTAEQRRQQAAEEKVLIAKVTRSQYQLSLCEIASPVEGTVVAIHYAAGEGVQSIAEVIVVAEASGTT